MSHKDEVFEAREILWKVFLKDTTDERVSEAVKLCNKYIRGEA